VKATTLQFSTTNSQTKRSMNIPWFWIGATIVVTFAVLWIATHVNISTTSVGLVSKQTAVINDYTLNIITDVASGNCKFEFWNGSFLLNPNNTERSCTTEEYDKTIAELTNKIPTWVREIFRFAVEYFLK